MHSLNKIVDFSSLLLLLSEPGCSQCHRGITIGDWRDPLDPELDAQVLYSQFFQGRSALVANYLGRYPV